MEQTKNLFLACNNRRNEFLEGNFEKRKKVLNSLLWNLKLENKKIANFSLKTPFDMVVKIDKNSDFEKMWRWRELNSRLINYSKRFYRR